jgi:hypothetical protein
MTSWLEHPNGHFLVWIEFYLLLFGGLVVFPVTFPIHTPGKNQVGASAQAIENTQMNQNFAFIIIINVFDSDRIIDFFYFRGILFIFF